MCSGRSSGVTEPEMVELKLTFSDIIALIEGFSDFDYTCKPEVFNGEVVNIPLKINGCHHQLINDYGLSASHMKMNMFLFSNVTHLITYYRIGTYMINSTGATFEVE